MSKIARKTQAIFAGSAANNGQFGSAQAGTKLLSNDPAVIQALAAWPLGWANAVIGSSKFPCLEEFQALDFVNTYQLSYIFQEGIPEYDAGTTYFQNSIVKKTGTYQIYGSLTDTNIGHALTDATNWKFLQDLSAPNNKIGLLASTTFYVSSTGNDANTGLTTGSPWATVTHALSVLVNNYDQRGFTATIQMMDTGATTTYTAGASGSPSVTGPIVITGNAAAPTRVVMSVASNNAFSFSGGSPYQINIQNMQIQTTTTGYGVATTFGRVGLANITFGACAQGYHTASGPGGYIEYNGPIGWAGNTSIASQTYQQGAFNGLAQVVTLSGTPAWGTECVLGTGNTNQFWGGVTFAGTGATGKRYEADDGSSIQTQGGGANFFPGSVAGASPTGFYS